ncbi:MAG: AraC family transcriptional regulator [Pigmentiphaga sp.]|nr:AraC family transcriptional regulator [Pigmentiphaga sp.]
MSFEHGPLTSASTHGIAQREGMTLLRDSTPLGWRTLYASLVNESPWSAELPGSHAPGLAFCLARACKVVSRIGTVRRESTLRPRQFSVLPPSRPSYWSIEGSPQILHLYLHPAVLESVTQGDGIRLLPRLCAHDPVLDHVASMVVQMMHDGESGQGLLADQVALLLATRLVARHSTHARAAAPRRQLMAPQAWGRVCDYIEAHLGDDLRLDTLARVGGVHPSHLCRAFQANLGTSPHGYVTQQRLQKARQLLRAQRDSVADIAAQLGFSSQSHFASVFRKAHAMSPTEFRRLRG